MSRYLGMHIQRGKLDAVETMFVASGTDIAEGLCVKQTTKDTVAVCSAAGDAVYGVAGGKRTGVGVAVVRQGKIWMQLAAGITPSVGAAAYADAAGKATTAAKTGSGESAVDNTLIGYFTSDEVAENGVVNTPSYSNQVRCAQVFIEL